MNVVLRRGLDVAATLGLALFVVAVGATIGAVAAWLAAVVAP